MKVSFPRKFSTFRRSYRCKRACAAINRVRPEGVRRIQSVAEGILNPEDKLNFRNLIKADRVFIGRYLKQVLLEERMLVSMRKRLLNDDASDVEKEQLLYGFARIPTEQLKLIRKLEKADYFEALGELIKRYGQSGNGCDHNREFFGATGDFSPFDVALNANPRGGRRRPQLVYEAIDRLLFYVLMPPRELRQVFMSKTTYFVQKWGGNLRQIRSEGREGLVKVMTALLLHCDIKSMRCGVPDKTDRSVFHGLSRKWLAGFCNMTIPRVKSALRLLEANNLIHLPVDAEGKSKQRKTLKEDGTYKGHPLVRVLKAEFFHVLGLGESLLVAQGIKIKSKPPANPVGTDGFDEFGEAKPSAKMPVGMRSDLEQGGFLKNA